MDIRSFAAEATSTFQLRDANDELMFANGDETKPMRVTVYGPGSKTYAKVQAANHNRMIDRLKSKGKAKATPEEIATEEAERLAKLTKSMENIEYGDLQGEEMFAAIYADISIGFIADQVRVHIGEWGNFSKKPATHSPSTSDNAPG